MRVNNNDNPFTADLGWDYIPRSEDLDCIIGDMMQVNKLRWEYISTLQILAMPFEWLYSKLKSKKEQKCIYMRLVEFYEEGSQSDLFWDIDIDFYSSLFEIERRKSNNKFLRKVYDKAAFKVKYHMLPKTMEIEQHVA